MDSALRLIEDFNNFFPPVTSLQTLFTYISTQLLENSHGRVVGCEKPGGSHRLGHRVKNNKSEVESTEGGWWNLRPTTSIIFFLPHANPRVRFPSLLRKLTRNMCDLTLVAGNSHRGH